MGCWNETCMVSNMPIEYGEEVVMLIIQENRLDSNGAYYNSYWFLCSVMFGEYNDYGGIENVYNSDFALEWLKDNLMSREQGENRFHDHAVTPDDIDIEKLNKWFHGDRCQAKDVMDNTCSVQRAYVRKDIWDYLVNKDIRGWARTINKESIKQRFLDAFEVTKDFDYVDGVPEDKQEIFKKMRIDMEIDSQLSEVKRIYSLWHLNKKYFTENNSDLIAEMAMFVQHLEIMRKSLYLTTGSGSQSARYEELADFNEFVMSQCIDKIKEHNEMYEDDE